MGNCCDNNIESAPAPQPVVRSVYSQQPTRRNADGSPATSSHPSAQVLVIENICAIDRKFCLQQPVTLYLQEKSFSWSGDDFTVIDANSGVLYFKCDGKAFSFGQKKHLLDHLGYPVVTMSQGFFRTSFTLYRGGTTDIEICEFRADWGWFNASMTVNFVDVISRKPRSIKLYGDWRNKVCSISLGDPDVGGVPIGRIYRPTTAKTFFTGKQDYLLEIAPGIDIALLVMMCIALDEHKFDKR